MLVCGMLEHCFPESVQVVVCHMGGWSISVWGRMLHICCWVDDRRASPMSGFTSCLRIVLLFPHCHWRGTVSLAERVSMFRIFDDSIPRKPLMMSGLMYVCTFATNGLYSNTRASIVLTSPVFTGATRLTGE
jgi:hypothetical protein